MGGPAGVGNAEVLGQLVVVVQLLRKGGRRGIVSGGVCVCACVELRLGFLYECV